MCTSLEIVDVPSPDSCLFEAECGKGTYVRALARDLGRKLGCFGHVAELRRTRVGPFSEQDAISLERLIEMSNSDAGREALLGALLPVETALDGIPALAVSGAGRGETEDGASRSSFVAGTPPSITVSSMRPRSGTLVALGEVSQGELRPSRVFNIPL